MTKHALIFIFSKKKSNRGEGGGGGGGISKINIITENGTVNTNFPENLVKNPFFLIIWLFKKFPALNLPGFTKKGQCVCVCGVCVCVCVCVGGGGGGGVIN